jgi:murein L,D-transpeptidase YcbB/YkuD
MSAFGRERVRTLLLTGLSAAAAACATSVAFADPQSPLGPSATDVGAEMRLSSPLVGEDQGGGSRCPTQQRERRDNLLSLRDPPPIGRSEERPSFDWAMPSPTRGGGCANIIDLASEAPAPAHGPAAPDNLQPIVYDPTAGPPLSPMQSALQAALWRLVARDDRRNPLGSGDWRAARGAIAAFYAGRAYAPIWVAESGLTEAGRAALSQLERAGDDGLDLSAFAPPRELRPGLAPDALAEAETTIASAVVTYAEQATGSRVRPSHVSALIFATPSVVDPSIALAQTAAAADPAQRLADFNPPQKGYRQLRDELKRLEAPGVAERRPRALRADLDPDPLLDLQEEGAPQRTKRPAAGGIHTASASATFAVGASARERAAVLANMEMWRWEPRDMGERRIEVNAADFSVAVLEGDRVLLQSRVIVGKPQTPTPIFSNVMRYVLINPSWQVPDSIIKKEMMSKLGALSQRGYQVKSVGGRLTVRQLPGEDNALGRIAFMFPNDHAIYLHDTPARELFDEQIRAFSHGCVRVEDPLSLAELVLGGESGGWTEERIEASFGDKERTVFLPRPLPIHIEYFTDFVDEFGGLQERPDVYGLIRKVEGILARASQD